MLSVLGGCQWPVKPQPRPLEGFPSCLVSEAKFSSFLRNCNNRRCVFNDALVLSVPGAPHSLGTGTGVLLKDAGLGTASRVLPQWVFKLVPFI